MIPAKIDSNSIAPIRERDVESIIDWFDQHKQSFYLLGLSYLSNQQQMEELFYQTIIKVHKQLPRFKRDTSFETWVTSIFIHICRELSYDRSLLARVETEPRQDFFKALDCLKENEKDAVVLTYVKGMSKEEVAHLLQVSENKIKGILFSGIQSLRIEMGYGPTFNGCKEYHKDYINYLERTLDRPRKIDFEKHLYHCQDCQEDLASFQDVMLTMLNLPDRLEDFHVPVDFIENLEARLAEKEKHRQKRNKKRIRKGFVFAGIFVLLIGIDFFTGAFSNLYYNWTEKNQELRAFLQHDLGERLNLEDESDGVKIKIKGTIADEVQTLVFYEIEDTKKDSQYMMDNFDGVFVENQHEIMDGEGYQGFYPPDLESDMNKEEKNVYHGKISLQPINTDNGTIKLQISKLQKIISDSAEQNGGMGFQIMGDKIGKWTFEIPVTKKPSVEYALKGETQVEGIPVRFDKLTIAPTATVLHYDINMEQPNKQIDNLNFNHLQVNDKKVKVDLYARSFFDTQLDVNWISYQRHFSPLFGEKPKEVNVQLESAQLTFDDHHIIELDSSKDYPQTFEYAGSTISIDKVEAGQPAKVVISDHGIENRAYETLHFQIFGEDENAINSMEMYTEGVLMDKNGVVYDYNKNPVIYEEIEQPRHFITVLSVELQNDRTGEKVNPKRLEIYGYNAIKYLDDLVKISLK
ncbi:sigma-70 family RNA polymerase sigma factor [Neobacillus vireti]|uniref:sigma-70 family RNA polymerase sigma factor n=1 Tax=Neobacillus vireti TaxID=220686 RepID=UPI002FFE831F